MPHPTQDQTDCSCAKHADTLELRCPRCGEPFGVKLTPNSEELTLVRLTCGNCKTQSAYKV